MTKPIKIDPYHQRQKCSPMNLVITMPLLDLYLVTVTAIGQTHILQNQSKIIQL